MAQSIAEALLSHGNVKSYQLFVAEKCDFNFDFFKLKLIQASVKTEDLFGKFDCDVVIFCMRGSVIKKAIEDAIDKPAGFFGEVPKNRKPIMFLSCMSGVSMDELAKSFKSGGCRAKVIGHRLAYPINISKQLGVIIVGCPEENLTRFARTLLSSIGTLEYVPEDRMDAACAFAATVPAMVLTMFEAYTSEAGLETSLVRKVAALTQKSVADAILESPWNPISEMKAKVAVLPVVQFIESFASGPEASKKKKKDTPKPSLVATIRDVMGMTSDHFSKVD